jgi:hypothetical protein
MSTNNKTIVPPKQVARPINPMFKDRLPGIMSDICQSLMVIEPAVDRVTVQLREFLDYVEFEIQKTDLEIKQMEWQDKVDMTQVKQSKAWLERLKQLKADFNVDVMTSPPKTIRAMLSRVEMMFEV